MKFGLRKNKFGKVYFFRAYAPEKMFLAGDKGAVYDPTDLRTLFLDEDGRTQATGAGQPVALMKDISGRGIHVYQRVPDCRPLVTIDLARGVYRLSFDGANDFMATDSTLDLSATSKAAIFAAWTVSTINSTSLLLETSPLANSNPGAFFVGHQSSSGNRNYYATVRGTTALSYRWPPVNAAGSKLVTSTLIDLDAAAGVDELIGRAQGAAQPGTVVSGTTAGTGLLGNHQLFLGSRAGVSNFFSGHFYGAAILGRMATAAEIAANEAYYNQRIGAY